MDPRLFEAARTGDIPTLEALLREDPLLLERFSASPSDNPLHVSAFSGQADFAAELLRRKEDLAMELNQQGLSPLHIAAASGKLEVVRILDKKREVCFLKDKDGLIPLHCAVQSGRIDVVKELVSSFPDSFEVVTASEETPLHVAVKNNQVEVTKLLLKAIKDGDLEREIVNFKDREGNTVLHLATLRKQLQIVEMLIGEDAIVGGVNVNKQNRNWLTPKDILDVVIETEGGSISEMYRIVQIFQTVEANNAKEKDKRTTSKPSKRDKYPWQKIRSYLYNQITNATSEQRQTLMVVATLIATLTFGGVLQPPGGFKAEDSNGGSQNNNNTNNNKKRNAIQIFLQKLFNPKNETAGQSIMASRRFDFTLYASFNAIGFLASVTMISLLTKDYPLRNWMRLCVISMVSTYLVAMIYIAPDEYIFWLVILLVSVALVLREIYKVIKSVIKILRKMQSSSS